MEIDGNANNRKRKGPSEHDAAAKRKRVSRACDRCRVKKGAILKCCPSIVQANTIVPKTNAMDNVPAVQLVEPQANSVRTILAQRSEVSLKGMFEA